MTLKNMKSIKPCIIGLGYVGLPLMFELSKKFLTKGYDIKKSRIQNLKKKNDETNSFSRKDFLKNKNRLFFTNNIEEIRNCNFYIVTVPTPLTKKNKPDLSYIKKSCLILSRILKKNDIVFFESTVYPGVTEKFCPKYLKNKNKLIPFKDFFIGYSPERINPGDKKHSITRINKIVSIKTSLPSVKKTVLHVYKQACKKVIFSSDVQSAETAKVIENIQRDLNIALFNEIFILCEKLNINFTEVIRLASTKWNFIKFRPGLVGGHCLPVDPYYLSYLANKRGLNLSLVLAGRNINNNMKVYFQKKIIQKIKKNNLRKNAKILLAGVTYKKDVPDTRNSFSLDIAIYLKKIFKNSVIYDPYVEKFNNSKISKQLKQFEGIVILTNHTCFKKFFKFNSKIIKLL